MKKETGQTKRENTSLLMSEAKEIFAVILNSCYCFLGAGVV